jgi:hypothetical protein
MKAARIIVALLAVWVTIDLARPVRHDLREFDPHRVGRLEAEMWRSYYDHRPVALFRDLTTLLREQFGLPFWRSCLGAWYAAHAAVVFQRGHERPEYERALPDLVRYYSLTRRASATPFDVDRVARLELEWWIVHRQRDRYPAGALARALAELQAAVYGGPVEAFAGHAQLRAEAMALRDSGADWGRIAERLDGSWVSLREAVR